MSMDEMSILDKLMEKKDLRAYIEFRLENLQKEQVELPEKITEPEKQEPAIKQVKGRIKELKRLRMLLEGGKLKAASKEEWRSVQT